MQSSEEINSNGGFSFVKKLLDGNAHTKDWDAALPAAPNSCYSTSAIVRSAIGLMTAATTAMPTFKSSVPIFSSAGLWASAALGEAYNNFEL